MKNFSHLLFAAMLLIAAFTPLLGCGRSVSTTKEAPPGPKNVPLQPAKK